MLAIFIFFLSASKVFPIIPENQKKELFLKYVKETHEEDYTFQDSIPYSKDKIKELFQKYNFPDSYSFFEDTFAHPKIKQQGYCGNCWAFASTTSLAYRYFKKGVEVDLSPQHEMSCYIPDCDIGNENIDSQLSLVKNGTLTEECLPFTSGDKFVPPCPTTCEDPKVEYKIYNASNAYFVDIDNINFYDVTAIAIDQLLTIGPLVMSMDVYEDLRTYVSQEDCLNKVYSYDGKSEKRGDHALTLVGYGFLDNKYYWLLQNSWGTEKCQGFLKVEFGTAGVGSIAFSEPYVDPGSFYKIINLKFKALHNNCSLELETDANLDLWKSQLNIVYKNNDYTFNYICGVNKLRTENEKKIYCNFEIKNRYLNKGKYSITTKSYPMGRGNAFRVPVWDLPSFYFYGIDRIRHYTKLLGKKENIYLFISEKDTRISFLYEIFGNNDGMAPMKANENGNLDLKNCGMYDWVYSSKLNYIPAYCIISEDELKYFDDYSTQSENPIMLKTHCGIYSYQNLIVYRLNNNKYPIFRIRYFIALFKNKIVSITFLADIEGSLSGFKAGDNSFFFEVFVERKQKNISETITCPVGNPYKKMNNYSIYCSFDYSTTTAIDDIYVIPFYGVYNFESPFNVIIKNEMKNDTYYAHSFIIQFPISLLILLFLFSI